MRRRSLSTRNDGKGGKHTERAERWCRRPFDYGEQENICVPSANHSHFRTRQDNAIPQAIEIPQNSTWVLNWRSPHPSEKRAEKRTKSAVGRGGWSPAFPLNPFETTRFSGGRFAGERFPAGQTGGRLILRTGGPRCPAFPPFEVEQTVNSGLVDRVFTGSFPVPELKFSASCLRTNHFIENCGNSLFAGRISGECSISSYLRWAEETPKPFSDVTRRSGRGP